MHGVNVRLSDDGSSNTITIVEAGEPVVWTKPDELTFDPSAPLPVLGGLSGDLFYCAMADGSVRAVPKTVSQAGIRAAITVNGRETVVLDGR